MNHKKVLRLMNKYELLSVIRKKNPYAKIRKATQEHNTAKNILKRDFG
jgi:putative transposase